MPTEKQYEAMTEAVSARGDALTYFGRVFTPLVWLEVTPQQAERLKTLPEFTVREKGATNG